MSGIVYTKRYDEPEIDVGEVLRYAGCRTAEKETLSLIQSCIAEAKGRLSYNVCFQEFPVSLKDDDLDLSFVISASKDLKKHLAGCDRIILFAATVGLELDRLISRYSKISPARAFIFQAFGAERIEALCDTFNEEIRCEAKKSGFAARERFSPGYGDLPLEVQKDIFKVLECSKRIGLTLNNSMLMSPTKSVTAMIGIGKGD